MKTNWIIDLDGVMWLGDDPVEGSAQAVNQLLEHNCRVVFVTNMSRLPPQEQAAKLADCGVREPVRIVTSAVAAASLLRAGSRVLVCGGVGITEAVEARGGLAVSAFCEASPEPYDAVVVGMDSRFDYRACGRAMRAVRSGALLIGTNHDPTYPTPNGLEAGGGALLAAVAAAAETEPIMAGKPHTPMRDCVLKELFPREGNGEAKKPAPDGLVVGDRPDSDGLFAKALGMPFALVLSGVTKPDELPTTPPAEFVEANLSDLVARALY